MADLTVQDVPVAGISPSYVAASASGDRFQPRTTREVLLHVKNSDTASHDVVLDDPTSQEPVEATAFDPDLTVSVPAGEERLVKINPNRFSDSDGWVNLSWSASTGMTVAVFRAV